LNRLPELKSFLKDSEAEEYQGVDIEYAHGRKAVLTIYKDGEEQEQITLSDYKTKEEMHALMVEKGFVKKSDEEIAEMRRLVTERKEEEERLKQERLNTAQRRIKLASEKAQDNEEKGESSAEEKALKEEAEL
jgi:Sep15/SelM redox domain